MKKLKREKGSSIESLEVKELIDYLVAKNYIGEDIEYSHTVFIQMKRDRLDHMNIHIVLYFIRNFDAYYRFQQ